MKCSRCQGKVLLCREFRVQGDHKASLNHREHEKIATKEYYVESAPHWVGLHCSRSARLSGWYWLKAACVVHCPWQSIIPVTLSLAERAAVKGEVIVGQFWYVLNHYRIPLSKAVAQPCQSTCRTLSLWKDLLDSCLSISKCFLKEDNLLYTIETSWV